MFSWGGKSALTEFTDPNASLLCRHKNPPRSTVQPDSSHSCPSQIGTQDYGILHDKYTILIVIINSLIYYIPIAVSPPSFPPHPSPTLPSSSLGLCVTVIVTLITWPHLASFEPVLSDYCSFLAMAPPGHTRSHHVHSVVNPLDSTSSTCPGPIFPFSFPLKMLRAYL